MKKYISILCILFACFLSITVYATTDTLEGEAFTTSKTIEGVNTTDTIEGQTITSGSVAAWHEDDFSAGGRTTDVTGGGVYWDSEDDGDLAVAGAAMVATHDDDDNMFVKKDKGSDSAEGWCQFTITISDVTGHGASGNEELVQGNEADGTEAFFVRYLSDGAGDYYRLVGKLQGDGGDTETFWDIAPGLDTGSHTIKVHYVQSDNGSSNGILDVYFDGTRRINITGVDNDVDNDIDQAFTGWGEVEFGPSAFNIFDADTYTTTFDNWEWREDDDF